MPLLFSLVFALMKRAGAIPVARMVRFRSGQTLAKLSNASRLMLQALPALKLSRARLSLEAKTSAFASCLPLVVHSS
jgi:hypothetical protein